MKLVKLDENTIAFKASALGNLIQKGIYKQVGMVRTLYKQPDGSTTKSIEAVLQLVKSGVLYAVEQHRGLAISTKISDLDMLIPMRTWLQENDVANGEGFVYDQVIDYGIEDIERSKVDKSIGLLPEEVAVIA